LATQARDPAPHYQHSELGYNYRMSNILAGVGRAQLEVLDERVHARRVIFDRYVEAFGDIDGFEFMPDLEGFKHNRWLTTLTIDPEKVGFTPMELIDALSAENIEARPVWKPLHLQPLFEGAKYYTHEEGRSVSYELFDNGVCLPSGSNMTIEQQERVIHIIGKMLKAKSLHV
ncbi:DegT/DnrJ/EryC1/StrS family aminotransferase, partial [Domibacillus mangrovi]